jgi:integrase
VLARGLRRQQPLHLLVRVIHAGQESAHDAVSLAGGVRAELGVRQSAHHAVDLQQGIGDHRQAGDADTGLVFDAGKLALADYLDRWLDDSVKDTVRQRTYERYESIARVHIKPAIGRVKLKALTPAHARALYRQKLDSGLSPRTVNYIHVTLHKALSQAASDGLVPRNVSSNVKAPRPDKPEIRPLSPEQARTLIRVAGETGDRYEALYVLSLHCGLREGGLLGLLRWNDVDLSGTTATLQVRRTLSETRTGHKFEKPKNGKGNSVKCSQKATEALRSHRTRRHEERLRIGEAKDRLSVA